MQEWTDAETCVLKAALRANDNNEVDWEQLNIALPAKDINQIKAYALSLQQQTDYQTNGEVSSKAPIEIWTDLAQKLTSESDKAASVCLPQEEIYAVQKELREVIVDQQNKLSKLVSSLRTIKKIVKKTKRQNRRKLAEQNAKIDTLISLLASNALPTAANSSNVDAKNSERHNDESENENSSSVPKNNRLDEPSLEKPRLKTRAEKQILPLITVSEPSDIELSPYSLVPIGQNSNVMLTRQQYNDAYFRGKNIRRFAVRLAEKIFGLDVLTRSTVSGQQAGLEKLDSEKLSAIRGEVVSRFMPAGTLDEREAKWKECLLSIGKRCQVLRTGKTFKQDALNPNNSCNELEVLQVSMPNTNEHNAAAETITGQSDAGLTEVDKSLKVSETPPQVNLVPLGGSPNVLIQKEDLTEAVKRGKKATFLALRLAEKVFGYDVLLGSTITGREGTEKLNNDKLMAIKEEIVNRFAREQPIELQEAIWKKCLYSISTKCKVLRAQKQTIDGVVYEDDFGDMKVSRDLDLLANVTCPETHPVIMDDQVEQASGGMPPQANMISQSGDMIDQQSEVLSHEVTMVTQEAVRNPITDDEVAMEHEQEVTATIHIDQSNGLCDQDISGDFV
ncbi:uncharacterized protein LOC124447580 isoform X2 [Xenia sp. Carnegie-2017]|nr:uncharacterized protein LOC124447580 isoform X2 [Xenia sp. Carnegie-2017]XP_046854517.1 uncharacterized protein LOC124447580 isoform X2 [Xenia sp. Carnegie-2017]